MPEETKKSITEEKQVEEAKAALERIISWINNCDTKTGRGINEMYKEFTRY